MLFNPDIDLEDFCIVSLTLLVLLLCILALLLAISELS